MGLREVTRYLVVKAMVDRRVVEVLYEYFSDGHGDIVRRAIKYGLAKKQLRGYIQRILEKEHNYHRARAFVKHLAPIVLRIVAPAIDGHDGYAVCRFCGAKLPYDDNVVSLHMVNRHQDIVEQYVDTVIEILRSSIKART